MVLYQHNEADIFEVSIENKFSQTNKIHDSNFIDILSILIFMINLYMEKDESKTNSLSIINYIAFVFLFCLV